MNDLNEQRLPGLVLELRLWGLHPSLSRGERASGKRGSGKAGSIPHLGPSSSSQSEGQAGGMPSACRVRPSGLPPSCGCASGKMFPCPFPSPAAPKFQRQGCALSLLSRWCCFQQGDCHLVLDMSPSFTRRGQ